MTTHLQLEVPTRKEADGARTTLKQLPLYLALIPFLLITYQNLFVMLGRLPRLPVAEIGVAMFVALFSLFHNLYTFGWRSTLALFGITLVVSWGFEQAGVATGLIYGVYHYSPALGPKLGHVPYAIPIAWYSMLYLSYVMALLITRGSDPHSQPGWWMLLWQAFVSGMIMTAWDVLVDPMASAPNVLSWVWEHGGG
ncbi:MAG: carotenoid biosynthesis protein, partial [Caldilineaceae bacterium]|nr:carotenoid biosynthesis protein [Caldilineaceae bacterium]